MIDEIFDAHDLTGSDAPGNSPERFQVLVRLDKGLPDQALVGMANAQGGRIENLVVSENSVLAGGKGSVYVLSFPDTPARDNIIDALSRRPGIELAELDATVHTLLTSTDTHYANGILWGMLGPSDDGIGAFSNEFGTGADVAWANASVSADGKAGSMRTVVGVIDTGIDPLHPDLYLNIWINQNEIPAGLASDQDGDGVITFRDLNVMASGNYVNAVSDVNGNGRIDADDILQLPAWANGVDDDGNGYLDDLFGWDFRDNDNRPFESYTGLTLTDEPANSYHGTHVAGTIGAPANGIGVVGVAWDVQIMPLRFIGPGNSGGNTSDAVQALYYYTALGQSNPDLDFVGTNNSWGGGPFLTLLADAIQTAGDNGQLFIAAAGNDAGNNDLFGHYPASYSVTSTFEGVAFDPVISVASINDAGELSSFSNYGSTSVDLAAPGSDIASTFAGDEYFASGYTYLYLDGTSMAAPHVTGAAALIATEFPGLHPADLRAALLGGVTTSSALDGEVATDGRLNIPGSIDLVGPAPVITIDDTLLTLADTGATVTFTFSEAVTGFTLADISVSSGHGSVSGLTSNDDIVWTATFTPGNVETQSAQIFVGNRFTSATGDFGRSGESALFAIDRIAPSATVSTIAATQDGSGANIDGTISAALGPGEALEVYRDGGLLGNANVTGTTWRYDDLTALGTGTYQYTARPIDGVGNQGTLSSQAPLFVPPPYDFTLTLSTPETGQYGNGFGGAADADGRVTGKFTGTGQNLVLSLTGFDIDGNYETQVLLNGDEIGYLTPTPNNGTGPSSFIIPASEQLPGDNEIAFVNRYATWIWGLTDILLEPVASTDFTLTLSTPETGQYGNGFGGAADADGRVTGKFTGTGQNLVLSLTGFDIDGNYETQVLLNGDEIGYLTPTPNNGTGPSSFIIPASEQLPGDNEIAFVNRYATWIWGLTDIAINPIV